MRGGSKSSRNGQSGQRKEKSYIRVLELIGATHESPKDEDADAGKFC